MDLVSCTFSRYHEWREIWQNEKVPGEDNINALRWQIRVSPFHYATGLEPLQVPSHVLYINSLCVGTDDATGHPILCGKCCTTGLSSGHYHYCIIAHSRQVYNSLRCSLASFLQPPRRPVKSNSYVVPTDKKRLALRWEIRHQMAQQ